MFTLLHSLLSESIDEVTVGSYREVGQEVVRLFVPQGSEQQVAAVSKGCVPHHSCDIVCQMVREDLHSEFLVLCCAIVKG